MGERNEANLFIDISEEMNSEFMRICINIIANYSEFALDNA